MTVTVPFTRDNLPEAIEHARVVVLAGYWDTALELSVRALLLLFARSR